MPPGKSTRSPREKALPYADASFSTPGAQIARFRMGEWLREFAAWS